MLRKTLALIAVAAATALALAAGAVARPNAKPTLVATVGPGFTLTVKMHNKAVKTLKAGVYKLVVHDKAAIHAFSLDGPHGYAKDFTTVPFVGTKTFKLKLVAGAYKAYCPPHEPNMFQHFSVTK
ncbi:MAG TPA: hypothetical protein VNH40_03680 [Gaiellaceae bacterium]|nr:hypothetical protein [Gaiellaceae bacterium]